MGQSACPSCRSVVLPNQIVPLGEADGNPRFSSLVLDAWVAAGGSRMYFLPPASNGSSIAFVGSHSSSSAPTSGVASAAAAASLTKGSRPSLRPCTSTKLRKLCWDAWCVQLHNFRCQARQIVRDWIATKAYQMSAALNRPAKRKWLAGQSQKPKDLRISSSPRSGALASASSLAPPDKPSPLLASVGTDEPPLKRRRSTRRRTRVDRFGSDAPSAPLDPLKDSNGAVTQKRAPAASSSSLPQEGNSQHSASVVELDSHDSDEDSIGASMHSDMDQPSNADIANGGTRSVSYAAWMNAAANAVLALSSASPLLAEEWPGQLLWNATRILFVPNVVPPPPIDGLAHDDGTIGTLTSPSEASNSDRQELASHDERKGENYVTPEATARGFPEECEIV